MRSLYRLFCFLKLFPMVGKGLKIYSRLYGTSASNLSTVKSLPQTQILNMHRLAVPYTYMHILCIYMYSY